MSNTTTADLVITHDWSGVARTAKYERMLRRRAKILSNLSPYQRQVRVLEQLLGEADPGDGFVLEVACGMGFHLLELSARGWGGTIGMEIDPELCRLTGDAAGRFALSTRPLGGDACAIPLADESCAVVFSHSFFEHVYDVDLALREQVRVLRPGGRLLIFDGNLLNPKTVIDLLFLYPLRTKGRHGGLKWALTKSQVRENLYGYLPQGRDEDIKTPGWWRRRIEREPRLRLIRATSGGYYTHPRLPGVLQTLLGSCVTIAQKV